MKQLVIIGAGVAGVTAAQEARLLHPKQELSITIIAKEHPPSYSRPRLLELLAGEIREDALMLHDQTWFRDRDIQILCPAEVTGIDASEQKIHFRPLEFQPESKLQRKSTVRPESSLPPGELSYHALILATGSSALAPVMPDAHSPAAGRVFALRSIADVRGLRQHLAMRRRKAAVLGGGLLGLEAARSLKDAGVEDVHVLEVSGYLLNRQLNRTASEMLRLYLEREEGIVVHTGVQVDTNELKSRGVDEVLRPVCGDGMETLLYSMGVRSQLHLAREAGLDCGKGILINEQTATSNPAIFAAGDCAEFQGAVWAIIPSALEQGKKAAEFACWRLFPRDTPRPEPYRQTVPRTTITVGRREAVSVGKAVLTMEEENSGSWKNLDLGSPAKRGQPKAEEVYVNLVEDTEAGTIVGGLAFGPRGISVPWLSRLRQAVGKSLREIDGSLLAGDELTIPAESEPTIPARGTNQRLGGQPCYNSI